MPVYEYEAVNTNGEKISGSIEAKRSSMVVRQLKKNGYYVTSIKEEVKKRDLTAYFKTGRVKTKDLTIFSQQFAAMIDAGISLVECLNIMYEETGHTKLKEVIRIIKEDIETGSSLSEAMVKHPKVFPTLYCQLVRAGETGGVLNIVLNKLADHYERQEEINEKVKSASYYPVTIFVVTFWVVFFLLVSVFPNFVDMFDNFGAELPGPTQFLIGISNFFRSYWWFVFMIVGGLITLFFIYKKTTKGEFKLDNLVLKIPIIGKMMKKVIISRFASTMAILLGTGVDLLSSLNIVEEVVGNKVYSNVLINARGQIREGISFSRSLADSSNFPIMVVQMVKIGEESGNLEKMLKKITKFYNREVESVVEGSISLIEPVMIVFLAVIVGFVVISIVLPMFDMYAYM